MLKVSILGVTGYTGQKLLEILLKHHKVTILYLASKTYSGKYINEVLPMFKNKLHTMLIDYDLEKINNSDVVFSCLPAGELQRMIKSLKAFVIDLSPDFRFKNSNIYKKVYNFEHSNIDLLNKFVYSIPEINSKDIKKAANLSNPGCYAISVILALFPIKKYLSEVFVTAASGVSGAGRKIEEKYLFTEIFQNYYPYSLPIHRHTYEIEEFLGIRPYLITHLLPIKSGILSTMFIKLKEDIDLNSTLKNFYRNSSFVRILDTPPMIKNVLDSNFCDIYAIKIDKKKFYIFSAIDNLYKGASGNAVQSMNIKFGFQEELGLI